MKLTAEKRKEHNRILAIRRHFKNKATDNPQNEE
jgi:hypothetical protein